ncbi:MAG: C40 family peptidase [Oscillospiraceae bacterium]|nr:C40 family peptidase [Oscillospiraceae bacterium]
MKQTKLEILLATAEAFLRRGSYVQYDQRSMDRVLELTPRRRKYLPPEAANSQYTQFLDCSGYTSAVYLQAFNYLLPADLTWHMVDQLEPRLYYYERTHKETPEDFARIEAEIRAILQPGDLITYQRQVGSGHIVMYLGNEQYTDCTVPRLQPNSYNYQDGHNNFYDNGGLWVKPVSRLFLQEDTPEAGRALFADTVTRFSVSRPLDVVGEPTPAAIARVTTAKDLWCAVENSAPGLRQAAPGGEVEYRLIIRNCGQEARSLDICFRAPAGCVLTAQDTCPKTIAGGEELQVKFRVRVDESNTAPYLDGPTVIVNELNIFAHRVLLGRGMTPEQWATVKKITADAISIEKTALAAAAEGYAAVGVQVEPLEKKYTHTHFFLHDSTKGDVLSRCPQVPERDLAVYSAFGGKAVITPEMGSTPVGPRTTYFNRADLLPGDILLCLEDGLGTDAFSVFYDGESLTGRFAGETACRCLTGDALDAFVDGLFAHYAFLLLRPAQGI